MPFPGRTVSPCNRRYYYLSSFLCFFAWLCGIFRTFCRGKGSTTRHVAFRVMNKPDCKLLEKTDLMDILSFPVRRHGKHLSAESPKNEYCFFFPAIYAKLIKWHFGHEEEGEQIGQTVLPHEKKKKNLQPLSIEPNLSQSSALIPSWKTRRSLVFLSSFCGISPSFLSLWALVGGCFELFWLPCCSTLILLYWLLFCGREGGICQFRIASNARHFDV